MDPLVCAPVCVGVCAPVCLCVFVHVCGGVLSVTFRMLINLCNELEESYDDDHPNIPKPDLVNHSI